MSNKEVERQVTEGIAGYRGRVLRWVGDLIEERDAARKDVERLTAELDKVRRKADAANTEAAELWLQADLDTAKIDNLSRDLLRVTAERDDWKRAFEDADGMVACLSAERHASLVAAEVARIAEELEAETQQP